MSDRFIQVVNFAFGLDTRKSQLLEGRGSLVQCQDAHINSGGEAEQRKSFVKSTSPFPVSTYGLEITQSGLITFGSVATPGALPTGVSYRRCIHPTGFDSSADAAMMISCIGSCNYAGLAFVVAKFTDGNTYAYYGDVSPMPQVKEIWRNGVILYKASNTVEVNSDLANDFTALLNVVGGFSALANQDINGNAINGEVVLLTSPGVHAGFSPSVVTTASGNLTALLVDQNVTGIIQQSSSAAFSINNNAGTITITAPATSGGSGTAILCTLVAAQSTSAKTAYAIIAAINANTATSGYTASNGVVGEVVVNAPLAWGTSANGFILTCTLITMTLSAGAVPFAVSVSPTILKVPNGKTGTLIATITGYSGTPQFTWTLNNTTFFTISNSTSFAATVFNNVTAGAPASTGGTVKVVDVGGTGNIATANFTVGV